MSLKSTVNFALQYLAKSLPRKNDCNMGGKVALYYYKLSEHTENLGDYLSKVVVSHFMPKNTTDSRSKKKRTLYAIGSVIGFRCQDAVVWGSGILSPHPVKIKNIKHSKLDIRAVRGPKTRKALLECNKVCPEVYGDPAILMPYIYSPKDTEKKYKVSLVFHYDHNDFEIPQNENIHLINIKTSDYESFIDEISQSSLVISSSLHGVILAETYGVPAVTLLRKDAVVFKFEDWYNSTGRENIVIARSIEEALSITPMSLPDLSDMQKGLLDAFPTDLW